MTVGNIYQELKNLTYNLLILNPKTFLFKKMFPVWQNLGFYLIPNHYYEPIPDTRDINDNFWAQRLTTKPITFEIANQLKLLETLAIKYRKEYTKLPSNPTSNSLQYYVNNVSFCAVDGDVYWSLIRHFKPRKIIEVGSGFSTLLAISALEKNKKDGQHSNLIVIDPYPSKKIARKISNKSNLILKKVQEMPPSLFQQLQKNDILFIDSSHILKIGSDLYHIFLKILPILRKGVIVHFHDIFLPNEYPKDFILKSHYFYNEQYFLYSFLLYNNSFKVLLASDYIRSKYPKKLKEYFPSFSEKNLNPVSFWVQKIK